MIKALALLAINCSLSASCPSGSSGSSNRTCLLLTLYDKFGDGWDGAQAYLETPWGDVFSDAPTCDRNPVVQEFCTDTTGAYPIVVINENESYVPRNYWEIFWKVEVVDGADCTPTGEYYTGTYNTTMMWNYDAGSDTWSLVYWENLIPNTKECDACGDASGCKPKAPKKKKDKKKKNDDDKKKNDDDKKKSDDDKKKNDDDRKGPIDSDDNNTTKVPKSKPRYGPPAVNLRITMFDEQGDGWWQDNYMGNSWYLADDTRTELFYTGTLCNGTSGFCNLCLGDGSYTIRFTGNVSDDWTAWDFCGVQGEYAQELSFHVYKGKCIPDALVNLDQVCLQTASSSVTLSGVIALAGFHSEIFHAVDSQLVAQVLGEFVTGWGSSVQATTTTLDTRGMSLSDRRLSEYTFDVGFEVTFHSESVYHVDGRDFRAVESLVEALGDKLSSRLASEDFISQLSSAARLSSSSRLSEVRAVELVSLELDSIAYQGVEEMQQSTLPPVSFASWGNTVHTKATYDYTTIAVFFGALAVAFIAFVGILSHTMNGYKPLSDDSQHPITFSHPEVMMSDMDQTVGGLGKAVGGPMSRQITSDAARALL